MRNLLIWILVGTSFGSVCVNCSNQSKRWVEEAQMCLSVSDSVSLDFKSMDLNAIQQVLSDANSISNQLDQFVQSVDTLTVDLAQPMDQFLTAFRNGNQLDIEFQTCKTANLKAKQRIRLLIEDIQASRCDFNLIQQQIKTEQKEVATIRAHSIQIKENFSELKSANEQFKSIIQRYSNSIPLP